MLINNKASKKNIIKSFFRSQLLLLLLFLVLIFFLAWPLIINLNKRSQLDREIEAMKAEVAKAELKNNEFKKVIDYLESNQFAEEQARLNFNLKKEGERVAVIKDNIASIAIDNQVQAESEVKEIKAPYSYRLRLKQWLDYFFGQE